MLFPSAISCGSASLTCFLIVSVVHWLGKIIGEPIEGDIAEALKDGVKLCRYVPCGGCIPVHIDIYICMCCTGLSTRCALAQCGR